MIEDWLLSDMGPLFEYRVRAMMLAPMPAFRIVESEWAPKDTITILGDTVIASPTQIRRLGRVFRNPGADAAWAADWWKGGAEKGWWES